MKELAIGEEIRIRCVKGISYCKDCALSMIQDKPHCANVCNPNFRTDREKIHFEIIDDVPEIHSGNILTEAQKQTIIDSFYTCQDKWVAKRTIEMIEEMLNQKDKDNGSN